VPTSEMTDPNITDQTSLITSRAARKTVVYGTLGDQGVRGEKRMHGVIIRAKTSPLQNVWGGISAHPQNSHLIIK